MDEGKPQPWKFGHADSAEPSPQPLSRGEGLTRKGESSCRGKDQHCHHALPVTRLDADLPAVQRA